MIIREQHMQAYKTSADISFEDEMVQHLVQFAPGNARVIGESGIRTVVQLGLKRARGYGFTYRGPLRFYLESMISFGSYFDTDPQLPWAAEILNDRSSADEMQRAGRLYDQTHGYYQEVMGPDNSYGIEAVRRIVASQPEAFTGGGAFKDRVLRGLAYMYPQKSAYIGDIVCRLLISRGAEAAAGYKITSEPGVGLLIGLMFGFGYGVLTDPLYPWVERTLTDTLVVRPDDRAARLYDKVKIYLRRVLANVEGR
jgi:hypothetical protein